MGIFCFNSERQKYTFSSLFSVKNFKNNVQFVIKITIKGAIGKKIVNFAL